MDKVIVDSNILSVPQENLNVGQMVKFCCDVDILYGAANINLSECLTVTVRDPPAKLTLSDL
jgi:hypothetical protein